MIHLAFAAALRARGSEFTVMAEEGVLVFRVPNSPLLSEATYAWIRARYGLAALDYSDEDTLSGGWQPRHWATVHRTKEDALADRGGLHGMTWSQGYTNFVLNIGEHIDGVTRASQSVIFSNGRLTEASVASVVARALTQKRYDDVKGATFVSVAGGKDGYFALVEDGRHEALGIIPFYVWKRGKTFVWQEGANGVDRIISSRWVRVAPGVSIRHSRPDSGEVRIGRNVLTVRDGRCVGRGPDDQPPEEAMRHFGV